MAEGKTILDTASEAVHDRRSTYGSPQKNFKVIAKLWQAYYDGSAEGEITEADVAQCMILVKVARLAETPDHLDSLVDIAGYAQCHEECLKETI